MRLLPLLCLLFLAGLLLAGCANPHLFESKQQRQLRVRAEQVERVVKRVARERNDRTPPLASLEQALGLEGIEVAGVETVNEAMVCDGGARIFAGGDMVLITVDDGEDLYFVERNGFTSSRELVSCEEAPQRLVPALLTDDSPGGRNPLDSLEQK